MNRLVQDKQRGTATGGTPAPLVRSTLDTQQHGGAGVSPAVGGAGVSPAVVVPKHPVTDFRVSRRRLPHWQSPCEVYFITFRTKEGRALESQERNLVLSASRFWDGKKIELLAVVVMPDHVHLLLQPKPVENDPRGLYPSGFHDLSEILHSIKSYSAHQIAKARGRSEPVWQGESYDRIVRDEKEFNEKWTYIANNAVMKRLAEEPEAYPWYWCQGMQEKTTAGGTPAPPPHSDMKDGAGVPPAVVPSQRATS